MSHSSVQICRADSTTRSTSPSLLEENEEESGNESNSEALNCDEIHSDAEYTDEESMVPKKVRYWCRNGQYGTNSNDFYHTCFPKPKKCIVFQWLRCHGYLV